jgi:D-3-phosphoglycerate dehydrogenase / 2-oxoglutarate reductase
VVSVPDYATEEVSDHTIALVMALCRGVVTAAGAVRAGRWALADAGAIRRLGGLRLGVVGLGRIGQAVARKAAALGFDVVGCDVAPPPSPLVPVLSLKDVLSTSDVVTLHVPLSAQTWHMIDAPRLALMRPTAFLVNTSRGGLVDQEALRAVLAAGALAGAGLDVLESEPPDPGDSLLGDGRVIITPHIAFYSAESLVELKRRAAGAVIEALARQRAAG